MLVMQKLSSNAKSVQAVQILVQSFALNNTAACSQIVEVFVVCLTGTAQCMGWL